MTSKEIIRQSLSVEKPINPIDHFCSAILAVPSNSHLQQSCPLCNGHRQPTAPTNTSMHDTTHLAHKHITSSSPVLFSTNIENKPLPQTRHLTSLQGAETINLAHKHVTSCSPDFSSRGINNKPGPQTRHLTSRQGAETTNLAHKHAT